MQDETISTSTSEYTVIAGTRYALLMRKVKLPANRISTMRRSMAGTHVMNSRNAISTESLPKMYSSRVSGFDR